MVSISTKITKAPIGKIKADHSLAPSIVLYSLPNVTLHGIPIFYANTGTDVRLHAECSEEDQQEREESENGLSNVNNSGSTNYLHKKQTPFYTTQFFGQAL